MSSTQRLKMPLLAAGQAQKELFHNEGLQLLDAVVAAAVEGPPQANPPASPDAGESYIVDVAPTGIWAGKASCLATYTSAGWRFAEPCEGFSALVRSTGTTAVFRGGTWVIGVVEAAQVRVNGEQVLGARLAAIADPVGGTTIDGPARAALGQILASLRQHGLIAT